MSSVVNGQTSFAKPEDLIRLLEELGGESYFGEPVTVLEHSLQAAFFATKSGSPMSLVVAALLHDVGHLLHCEDEDIAEQGVDTHHEELGDAVLAPHFPLSVREPIRLHVAAKRYLCAVDPAYLDALSSSSLLSLRLQGGPMTQSEAAAFLAQPFAAEGVALRRWDDAAKIPALAVPDTESYLALLRSLWH